MKSQPVSALLLVLLIYAAGHVHSLEVIASENPLPVGSNVTLSLSPPTEVVVGTWSQDTDNIVITYPGGFFISPSWRDRVVFNRSTAELQIKTLQVSDSGLYIFQGETHANISLSVQEPISNVNLMTNMTNLVEFNDSAVFHCSVAEGTSLDFVWLNDSSVVMESDGMQFSDGGSVLTIDSVSRYDHGPFRCNVSNGISSGSSGSIALNISYGPSDPKMMIMPYKAAYTTGSDITLSCEAESNPLPMYQWLFNGNYLNHHGPQLQLEDVRENQTGIYKCLAHNTVTSRFASTSATITIVEPISAVLVYRVSGPPILNESFTLGCNVTGPVDRVQWWRNDMMISTCNCTDLHMGMAKLTLNSIQRSDNGNYTCQAFNAVSNKTSEPYEVLVNYGPETPVITGESMALVGQNVTLTCSASSKPPSSYSWFFNGSQIASMAVYETGPVTLDMTGKYMCVAHNNITGRNSSAYKMLTVMEPVTMAEVTPLGARAIEHSNFTLTCKTEGYVDSHHWMYDGGYLHADSRRIFSPDNSTLTFDPVLRSDNGYYQCVASNPLSSLRSGNFTLHVNYGPENVTVRVSEAVIEAGDSVTLNCSATSYPPSNFTWYFNGTMVANTAEFETGPLYANMTGMYKCVADNSYTGRNSSAYEMLTIVEPITAVEIQGSAQPAVEGHWYNLTCVVTGPENYVHWMMNGYPLDLDDRVSLSHNDETVHFTPVNRSDTGHYSCMASNAVSNMTSPEYHLDVFFGPDTPHIYGPSIAEEGQNVTFNCSATSLPPSDFKWYFNGSMVANTSEYKIEAVSQNMSGEYTCVAYNGVTGKNSSYSEMLMVIEGIQMVRVVANTQPIASKNFTLICEVTGEYYSISWMKDGMYLDMNGSVSDSNMSYYIANNSLHFDPVRVSDDGYYQCTAINVIGPHLSPKYHLLVNYGPLSLTITGPTAVSIDQLPNVRFTCTADSRPESEYKWFFNIQPGAISIDSTLTVEVKPPNSGNYTCQARNPVTGIEMSKTTSFIITGHAPALSSLSLGILMVLALFSLSFTTVNNGLLN